MKRHDWKRDNIPEGDIVQGHVTYREHERHFEIRSGPRKDDIYTVDLDRIMTYRQFTDWIWQLHWKSWMNGQRFKDLLDCLSMVIQRDWDQLPQGFYEVKGAMLQGMDEV